jgi:hypothetical protein
VAAPVHATRGRRLRAAAGLVLALQATAGLAYETDQYSNRLVRIRDSRPALNDQVNRALARVVDSWRGPLDRWRFARRIYWILGGVYWVDHIERWAMASPEVEKLPQGRHQSIFRGAPVWATRVNWFFGVGRTIDLAGSLVGTDKLGHFFSQGVKYFGDYLAGRPESAIVGRGRFNERWLFGQWTTSVYSNADLVANYEGYRFYRSLFEDDVVPGKPAIVGWRDGKPFLQRPFDWADHVDDYWDEALNPSFLSPALQRYMDRKLPGLCADYRRDPEAFTPRDAPALGERYRGVGLKPAPWNRLDAVCLRVARESAASHAGG